VGLDDYWACPACSSLNRPAADRCYSCQAPRPEAATRSTSVEPQYDAAIPSVVADGVGSAPEPQGRPDEPAPPVPAALAPIPIPPSLGVVSVTPSSVGDASPARAAFCPKCGVARADGASFCVSCGYAFGPDSTAQSVTPSSALASASKPQRLPIAVVLGAVVLVGAFLIFQKPGSITFSPSTFPCAGETRTMTIHLPSSVRATDELSFQVLPDGVTDHMDPPLAGFMQQQDGSWLLSGSTSDTAVAECNLPIGSHTLRVLDSTGKVLAEGSFTRQ
jgi:hypothetical protein